MVEGDVWETRRGKQSQKLTEWFLRKEQGRSEKTKEKNKNLELEIEEKKILLFLIKREICFERQKIRLIIRELTNLKTKNQQNWRNSLK